MCKAFSLVKRNVDVEFPKDFDIDIDDIEDIYSVSIDRMPVMSGGDMNHEMTLWARLILWLGVIIMCVRRMIWMARIIASMYHPFNPSVVLLMMLNKFRTRRFNQFLKDGHNLLFI